MTMDSILEIRRKAQEAQGIEPTTDNPATDRDYRAMFRAAYTFHAQHRPNLGADYWAETVKALGAILAEHGGDLLLTGLLQAVYSDLEREYKRLLEGQPGA